MARFAEARGVFGPLGVTNIRTFVDPQNPNRVALLMDVADMDVVMAEMESGRGQAEGDGARRRSARDDGDPDRGVAPSASVLPRGRQLDVTGDRLPSRLARR